MSGLLINRSDRGFISLIVLWIITFLAVITAEFSVSVRNEVKTLHEMRSSAKAHYAAEAGFNCAIKAILDGELDNYYRAGVKKESVNQNQELGFAWRLNAEMPHVQLGDVNYRIWIGNESGRLNINESEDKTIRKVLFATGSDGNDANIITSSILDWIDPDDLYRLNGAESDYYKSLKNPYLCKNKPFSSIDEILIVRGMTNNFFYNRKISDLISVLGFYSNTEKKSDIQTYLKLENAETEKGIQEFLTLSGQEKAAKIKDYDYSKINVNAASPAMLFALPGMNEKVVSDIIEYRKNSDFTSIDEFAIITGPEVFSGIKDYLHVVKNKFYEITVDAWMADGSGKQKIKWIVYIDNKSTSKKIKILEKIINPDIYAGLEYYDYNRR